MKFLSFLENERDQFFPWLCPVRVVYVQNLSCDNFYAIMWMYKQDSYNQTPKIN